MNPFANHSLLVMTLVLPAVWTRTFVAVVLTIALAGCWSDGPVPAVEEGEILFGSTAAGSGRLATEYDFGAAVHVSFSSELGGLTVYSGVDPGFVSVDPGQRSGSLSPLAAGVPVAIEITDIDAGARLVVFDKVLAAVGDAASLGITPVHMHPEWQLILPSGSPPTPHFVSFVFTTTDPAYAPSEPYTLTIEVEE